MANTPFTIERRSSVGRKSRPSYSAPFASPGQSVTTRRPVTDEFLDRFPATIQLAIAAMFFSILVGIPLGFLAAKRYGSLFDHFSLFASLLGISIPI